MVLNNRFGDHLDNDIHETRTIGGGSGRLRRSEKDKEKQSSKKIAE